jgi:hypothetical protein
MTQPTLSQTWQDILNTLEGEIPSASFNNWLRPTQMIGRAADGVVQIGVPNAFVQDYLAERFSEKITALLGEPVRFIQLADQDEERDTEDVYADEPSITRDEDDDSIVMLSIEVADDTALQIEVNPSRAIIFPGYALRLLDQGDLSPKQMSIWLSFLQCTYRVQRIDIPHTDILRFAMMSRASFFREISGKKDIVPGLVMRLKAPQAYKDKNGHYRRNANRYRIYRAPRLTRRDAATLENLLTRAVLPCVSYAEAEQAVLQCLNDLALLPASSILDEPNNFSKTETRAFRVVEIVRNVLDMDGDMSEALHSAAEHLHNHLIGGFGLVSVPLYFVEKLAPLMGWSQAQVWALIVLRDRCWFDHQTKTAHNFAILRGGLAELAQTVGVSLKSVSGWMSSHEFACMVAPVQVEDPPYEWTKAGSLALMVRRESEEILVSEVLDLEKMRLDLEKVRLYSEKMRLNAEKMRLDLEKMRLYFGKNETHLLNFKNLNQPQKPQQIPTNRATADFSTSPDSGGRNVSQDSSAWNWDALFKTLDLNPKTRKRLRAANIPAWTLVAWILQARTMRGVNDPVAFAISRVASQSTRFAVEAHFAELARNPDGLLSALQHTMRPYQASIGGQSESAWEQYQRALGTDRVQAAALFQLLTGEQPPVDVTSVSTQVSFDLNH